MNVKLMMFLKLKEVMKGRDKNYKDINARKL